MRQFEGAAIQHELNLSASRQFEVIVGEDHIARVNVDGVCVLRVRCAKDAQVRLDCAVTQEEIEYCVGDDV